LKAQCKWQCVRVHDGRMTGNLPGRFTLFCFRWGVSCDLLTRFSKGLFYYNFLLFAITALVLKEKYFCPFFLRVISKYRQVIFHSSHSLP